MSTHITSIEYSFIKNIPSIREFINSNLGKVFEEQDLERVLYKILSTDAAILKEEIPYLKDNEFNRLLTYKKQKKKKTI